MTRAPDPAGLVAELARLRARVERLELSSRLSSASIGDGSIRSDNFDGDLAAGDAGSQGWALGPDGAVLSSLVVRDGSITSDALSDPVWVWSETSITDAAGSDVFGGNNQLRANWSVTVPTWIAVVSVTAIGVATIATSDGPRTFTLGTTIQGVASPPIEFDVLGGGGTMRATATNPWARTLSGVAGGTVGATAVFARDGGAPVDAISARVWLVASVAGRAA